MSPKLTGIELDGVPYDVGPGGQLTARVTPAPAPDPTPVQAPNVVRAGAATYPLAGLNPTAASNPPGAGYDGARGSDQITAYQGMPACPTNRWGADAVVVDGVVASVVDRQATGGPGVTIPDGAIGVSGHGRGREWILAHLTKGTRVEFARVDDAPAAGGALPAWVVSTYWHQYEGPDAATVSGQGYGLIWAAFGKGAGGQVMTFNPTKVQTEASFRDQVAQAQAGGVRWGLSIGGGVKAPEQTLLRTKAEATAVFRGLKPIIDKYSFSGIDDDLENGPSGFTLDGLQELFRLLRGEYGPDFVLASTPRPYEGFRVQYAAQLYAAGLLDLLQWQFYDAPEYRDAGYLRKRILDELDNAKAAGVPYSAQVIGSVTLHTYDLGWNSIDAYEAVIREAKATRGVRGGFVWHAGYDRAEGWSFARRIGALRG